MEALCGQSGIRKSENHRSVSVASLHMQVGKPLLTFGELSTAKLKLLLYVQQQEFGSEICALQQGLPLSKGPSLRKLPPFVGKDGLLRIQGRLQLSGQPYDAKHPIIVPKGHVAILLARQVHQVMKHAGVNGMLVTLRTQYWIVEADEFASK